MQRRVEWTYRLSKELLYSSSAYFITLTYSDENIPDTGNLVKKDLQNYIKKLRKYGTCRYYAIGEYGEIKFRPHYHILLFNYSPKNKEYIVSSWDNGNVYIGRVETASIHYCSKDMMKDSNYFAEFPVKPFAIMSLKPPIGMYHIKDLKFKRKEDDFSVSLNNIKHIMPRIYKDALFSKFQKQIHAKKMEFLADEYENKLIEKLTLEGYKNPFEYLLTIKQNTLRREEKIRQKRLNLKSIL